MSILGKYLFSTAALLLLGLAFIFPKGIPAISWTPSKLEVSVFQGGSRMIEIKFRSNQDFSDVDIFIAPKFKPFIKIIPDHFQSIPRDVENKLQLFFTIPKETSLGPIEGTLHLKSGIKTLAKPFPIALNIISPQEAEKKLVNLLIQQFATTTPEIPDDKKFLEVPITPELESFLREGSDLPAVFKVGSFTFEGNLSFEFNINISNAIGDLLPLINGEGIKITDFINVLSTHRWHQEDVNKLLIPDGAEAITFLGRDIIFYDRDGNGLADTLVVILTDTTHTVLNASDTAELIARKFVDASGIKGAALTAIHELMHVIDFRTACGGSDWHIQSEEENFMSLAFPFNFEKLIQDLFFNKSTVILNADVDGLLLQFPNTFNCLEKLDLTRPTSVILNPLTNINTSTLTLSWSPNVDRDFESYKLFRSTSSPVSLSSRLVATIINSSTLTFTDTGLSSGQTFFYKLFTFDKAGLSSGSNQVSATTIVIGLPTAVSIISLFPSITDFRTAIRWTLNQDTDFASYRILRNNQNIFSVADRNAVYFRDDALPIGPFSYQVKVFNQSSQSSLSNAVSGKKLSPAEIISNIPNIPEPGQTFPSDFAIPNFTTPIFFFDCPRDVFGSCAGSFVIMSSILDGFNHQSKFRRFGVSINNLQFNNQPSLKFNVHISDIAHMDITSQDQTYQVIIPAFGLVQFIGPGETRVIEFGAGFPGPGSFDIIVQTPTQTRPTAGTLNILP